MVLSYGCVQTSRVLDNNGEMHANHWRRTPDEAHPELREKPLDAIIGRVPAPHCPGGRHGR